HFITYIVSLSQSTLPILLLSLLFLFFFLIIPPPPTSTLFPYTTLFRSLHVHDFAFVMHEVVHSEILFERVIDAIKTALFQAREIDRKSTRLNSSHLVISYAVFCLKKKKKIKYKKIKCII